MPEASVWLRAYVGFLGAELRIATLLEIHDYF